MSHRWIHELSCVMIEVLPQVVYATNATNWKVYSLNIKYIFQVSNSSYRTFEIQHWLGLQVDTFLGTTWENHLSLCSSDRTRGELSTKIGQTKHYLSRFVSQKELILLYLIPITRDSCKRYFLKRIGMGCLDVQSMAELIHNFLFIF